MSSSTKIRKRGQARGNDDTKISLMITCCLVRVAEICLTFSLPTYDRWMWRSGKNSKFEAHGVCSDGEFKPAHRIITGGLNLRGWADTRLGRVLGGPSRTLPPQGTSSHYPAYTSWVSRVDVQFVDAS